MMRITANGTRLLTRRAERPRGWVARGVGWMLRARPEPDAALYFPGCPGLHTLAMRFDLDIAFLDATNRVLEVRRAVRPWRTAVGPRGTSGCLEMPAGAMADLRAGDQLIFEPDEASD